VKNFYFTKIRLHRVSAIGCFGNNASAPRDDRYWGSRAEPIVDPQGSLRHFQAGRDREFSRRFFVPTSRKAGIN